MTQDIRRKLLIPGVGESRRRQEGERSEKGGIGWKKNKLIIIQRQDERELGA